MMNNQIIQTITKLRVGRIGKIIAGFVVTVLTVGIVSLLFTTDTTAGWFDDGWGFRRHIAFTHNADIGSERRVTITIDTATPISTSKMQSACQDVRFTDINGLLLSHQLTGTCNNASTTFDVVFPTIVNGSNPAYVYYGNFAASSASQDVSAVTSLSPGGSPSLGSEEQGLSPVVYLKFDEGYGDIARDSTSLGNNASLGGTIGSPGFVGDRLIRREINIIDRIVSASGDDSAIVQLDTTKYSGTVTYAFETVAQVVSGTLIVALERVNTSTQDATISVTATSFTRQRATFTPPSGATQYNINLSGGTTPQVKAARILVFQEAENFTASEGQFEIGNYETGKTNTSPATLDNPKYWRYDSANWSPTPTFYAEATYQNNSLANISFVQSAQNTNTGNNAVSIGSGQGWSTPTAGNLLVAMVSTSANSNMGVTDFTTLTQAGVGGGSSRSIRMFYKISDGTESTITSTTANTNKVMIVSEFSGVDTSNPLNIENSQTTASGTTHTTPTVNISGSNRLVVFATMGLAASRTWSNQQVNSSTTGVVEAGDTQTTSNSAQMAYKLSQASGNTNAVATISSTAVVGAAAIATFNPAPAPPPVTITLQQDDGNFGSWSNVTNGGIVSDGVSTTAVRVRTGSAFTPIDGRHYRIVSSISSGTGTYDVINAKIIAQQSTTIDKLESQYLLANTGSFGGSTGLKDFDTFWDPDEWNGFANSYYHEGNGVASGTGDMKLQSDPNGTPIDIAGSSITDTIPVERTDVLTMPETETTVDVNVTGTGTLNASRIIVVSDAEESGGGGGSWEANPPIRKQNKLCKVGGCLFFDGADSATIVSNGPALSLSGQLVSGFTFQTWFRANSLGQNNNGTIFSKGDALYARLATGSTSTVANIEVFLGLDTSDATLTLSDVVTLNRWHHIAVTYSDDADDEISVYVDGILRGSSTNGSGSPATDANQLVIGADFEKGFHGFIDNFKVYPYERTADQLKADVVRGATSLTGLTARFGPDDSWLSDGLVGYWEMDEASIPNDCSTLAVLDSSGNGFDGRACPVSTGPTGGNTGKFGNGITLNTSGHRIEIPDDPAIRFNSGDFSIFLWSYKTSVTATSILNKLDGGNDGYTLRTLATGRIRFQMNATFGDSASILPTNTWTHIGVVVRDGFAQIYINGVPDGSPIDMTAVALDTTAVLIFGDNATNFSGTMDETRFYNRALTPSEVDGLYNWAPGPVGYWKFDENTGTDVNDLSGNGNTGTLTNSGWAPAKYGSGMTGKIDNVQDYTNIPDPTSGVLDFGITDNFTIGFWSKVTLLEGNTYIVYKNWAGSPSAAGYGIMYSHAGGAGNVRAGYSNGTSADDVEILGAGINNGEWRYVTVVMDRTGEATGFVGFHVYIDGRLRGSDTSLNGTGSGVNSAPLRIGEDSTAGEFDGIIDDVRIYNYPRSQGQIIQDMNAGHPLGGSPVGSQTLYWKLDEGYGTTANDSSATGAYNGTLSSGVVWANGGKIGKAVDISTTARYVSAGDVAFVDGATTMTWSLWVNPQSLSTNSSILSKSNYSNQNNFGIRTDATNSDEIRVYIASSASDTSNYFTTSNLDLATGVWQHLLVVYDGTASATNRVKVYKDGRAVSGSITGTIPTSLTSGTTSELRVGRSMASNDSLIAHFDEVKIYAGALSLENALIDMTHGSATILGAIGTESDGLTPSYSASREYCVPGDTATCNPPVGHWKFDENTGTSAFDTSGNANTGTLTNGPEWVLGKFGGALLYNGIDQKVNIPTTTFSAAPATINMWVNFPVIPGSIRNFAGDSLGSRWAFSISSGNTIGACAGTGAGLGCNDGFIQSSAISTNKWYFITLRIEVATTYFYLDGVLQGTQPTGTLGGHEIDFGGAVFGGYTYANVKIDDVRIYDYARTPAQIKWDMDRGAPVGWWRLDECTGTTAYDASGNGNNGTLNLGASGQTSAGDCGTNANTAWYNGRNGRFGASLNFDGTDDYVDVGNPVNLQIGVSDFSYSAWVKTTQNCSGNKVYVGKRNTNVSVWLGCADASGMGKAIFQVRDSGGNQVISGNSITTINNGEWHHLVGIKQGGTVRIYVNGRLENSGSGSLPGNYNAGSFQIGRFNVSPWYYASGQIDDVRFYNYALTEAQIRDAMNQGAVRFGD